MLTAPLSSTAFKDTGKRYLSILLSLSQLLKEMKIVSDEKLSP